MTDSDRIQFLQGQNQAIFALAFALIETHPDRAELLRVLEPFLQGALAKISGEPVPEAFVDGLQDAKQRLLDYATKSAARR